MSNNGLFSYPEELEQRFVETEDIHFNDGTSVSSSEIWKFMTEEGPRRFPYAFDTKSYFRMGQRLSEDAKLFSSIKRSYLDLTLPDHLQKAHDKGKPIVLVRAHQLTREVYHAAGVIPLSVVSANQWVRGTKEGLNSRGFNVWDQSILDAGCQEGFVEGCRPAVSVAPSIIEKYIPIDGIAPFLCTHCSDITYAFEAHRRSKKHPMYFVDYPVNDKPGGKEWALEYLASNLRRLTKEISKISNKEISEEDLTKHIKLENQWRRLLQEYLDIWWSAPVPPTNSLDHGGLFRFANEYPDPIALTDLFKEANKEIKERIKHSIKGQGLADDPVRIWGGVQTGIIDEAGGVSVGDDRRSYVPIVDEKGEPYENFAKALLSHPNARPAEEQAKNAVELIKKTRADGAIMSYGWGCSYLATISQIMYDHVQDETGIPVLILGNSSMTESSGQLRTRVEAFIEMLK